MNVNLNNLSYYYKNHPALANITLNLNIDSKCIALAGHNGAGKSTLLNILCGVLQDYDGTLEYSKDVKIAYLPYNNPIYDQLTVKENLLFWFQLYNNSKFTLENPRVIELINEFQLDKLLDQKAQLLSSGEKRKTALACILLGDVNFIVLDEPFTGLDMSSVNELLKIITEYKARGCSFIISSHQLDILNKISDHTLILKEGVLVYDSACEPSSTIVDTYVRIYE